MSAHILVVDDDEKSQRLACDVLMHRGYAVSRADRGEDALVMAQAKVYDLALLDIQLPGLGGVETFKALRLLPGWARVPVLAMTASVMPEERSILMKEGFDGFVPKPLAIRELVRLVAALLASARDGE
jgi:two-component system cell cycle response regulator DivK